MQVQMCAHLCTLCMHEYRYWCARACSHTDVCSLVHTARARVQTHQCVHVGAHTQHASMLGKVDLVATFPSE